MKNRALLILLSCMGGLIAVLVLVLIVVVSGGSKGGSKKGPVTRPPQGRHDMSLTEFLATKPNEPKTFTFICSLRENFPIPFPWEEDKFWSVSAQEPAGGVSLPMCVEKNTEEGRLIFEMLRDGKKHWLEVELSIFRWQSFGLPAYAYQVTAARSLR